MRSGMILLALFIVSGFGLYMWMEADRIRYAPYTHYSTGYSDLGNFWFFYGRYYLYFAVIGTLFLLVFRQMHRTFLAMAKDEASFEATPPLVNRETSFGERVLIEWLVSFGFFLIAILAFLQGSLRLISTPQYPVLLFGLLGMTVGGSLLLATVSAAAPRFRWFVNLTGFGILLGTAVYCFIRTFKTEWGRYPLQEFFESPHTWPTVFGIMILDWIIVLATVMALIFGGLYLRSKWNGRSATPSGLPSKQTALIIFCTGFSLVLAYIPFAYSPMRCLYYERVLMDIERSEAWDSGNENAAKKIEIASALVRWMDDQPMRQINALQTRAAVYFKLRQFNEAIADYDKLIEIMSGYPRPDVFLPNYYANRGGAKLAIGDARGAIADLDKVLVPQRTERLWGGLEFSDLLYDRGYAHEQLGGTAAARADYEEAIRMIDPVPYREKRAVYSPSPRVGYDDDKHRSKFRQSRGFRISIEELTDICDRLRE